MNMKFGRKMKEYDDFVKKISICLKEIGMPANLKGYNYIKEAAEILYFNTSEVRISSEVYEVVALKYNTTGKAVERSIRHAIEIAFNRSNYKAINTFFGNSVNPESGRVSNKHFIKALI